MGNGQLQVEFIVAIRTRKCLTTAIPRIKAFIAANEPPNTFRLIRRKASTSEPLDSSRPDWLWNAMSNNTVTTGLRDTQGLKGQFPHSSPQNHINTRILHSGSEVQGNTRGIPKIMVCIILQGALHADP